jgi:hypothetical protein
LAEGDKMINRRNFLYSGAAITVGSVLPKISLSDNAEYVDWKTIKLGYDFSCLDYPRPWNSSLSLLNYGIDTYSHDKNGDGRNRNITAIQHQYCVVRNLTFAISRWAQNNYPNWPSSKKTIYRSKPIGTWPAEECDRGLRVHFEYSVGFKIDDVVLKWGINNGKTTLGMGHPNWIGVGRVY